ncbi:hypothetical protein HYX10_05570 [Candidatus Woesearchaeota archaeon]|nr:hypothetical protein [Candidatus Woesearchaeota archaeon]
MHSSYYESILQLRPRRAEVERFIEASIEKNGRSLLSKKKLLKGGADYYISSWQYASALGRLLVSRFGGRTSVSRKIFGRSRKRGQIVYRSAVLYRLHPFIRGDVVEYANNVIQVTSTGKDVIGRNLITGKSGRVGENARKLDKHYAVVSKNEPLEVIDPVDYQSIKVMNPRKTSEHKVKVVLHSGAAYLVD